MRRSVTGLSVALLLGASLLVRAPAAGQDAPEAVELRVMSFNIWYGATPTDGLDQVIEAIRLAGADVVGMQEPYARLRRIAEALGFHASPRMHVISRYPILEPAGSDGDWAFLLLGPGQVAAIANTHLPCCPYTPYRIVNKGMDHATALAQEGNTRVRRLAKHLEALRTLLESGIPTFFTGDFNSPSWRDWTRAAVEDRDLPFPVRWPVSLAMEDAGFRDSYRDAHPDPVSEPGFTWTPGYPAPFVHDRDVFDRIDFVWAAGAAETLDSRVVGEARANADIVIRPYPSDHRGVVSTFSVLPAPAPTFVAAQGERARLGHPLDVTFHSPAGPGQHLALVPTGSEAPVADLPAPGGLDATIAFDTSELAQGSYDAILRDGSGAELARDTVVLVADDQSPVLTLADDTLEGAEPLEVSWSFAPGNRFDWLGVLRAGRTAKTGEIRSWRYTDARIEGTMTIGSGARGTRPWPPRPGRYAVHLCLDDSYRCRVAVGFRVIG